MATRIRTGIDTSFGSDAEFRAWIVEMQAAFLAMGWVQTADTGQINSASATIPGSNNNAAGYEIWTWADARNATDPIVMKWEYGRGDAATEPGLWLSLGKGSNGSGSLTSPYLTRFQIEPSQVGALTDMYFTHSRGVFAMWWQSPTVGAASASCFFLMERAADETGAYNGVLYVLYATDELSQKFLKVCTITTATEGTTSALILPKIQENTANFAAAGVAGRDGVFLNPIFPIQGRWHTPMMGLFLPPYGGAPMKVTRRGVQSNYRPITGGLIGSMGGWGSTAPVPYVIWE